MTAYSATLNNVKFVKLIITWIKIKLIVYLYFLIPKILKVAIFIRKKMMDSIHVSYATLHKDFLLSVKL